MGTFICQISERDWKIARKYGVYGNKTGRIRDGNYKEFSENTKTSIIRDLLGMNVGDYIFFHVLSSEGSKIHGVYRVRREPYYSNEKVWKDENELYPYRFLFQPHPDFKYMCKFDANIDVVEFYDLIEEGKIWSLATLENERNIEGRSVRKIEGTNETKEIIRLLCRDFRVKRNGKAEPVEYDRCLEPKEATPLRDVLKYIGRFENSIKGLMMYRLSKNPSSITEDFQGIDDFMNEVFIAQTTRKAIDIFCIRNLEEETREYIICEVKTHKCKESSLKQLLYYMDLVIRNPYYIKEKDNIIGCLVGERFSESVIEYSRQINSIFKEERIWLIEYEQKRNGKDAKFKNLLNWRLV